MQIMKMIMMIVIDNQFMGLWVYGLITKYSCIN
jgi:hypothetical protein